MTLFWATWGFLLGAALGSFFAVALWRSKEGLPLSGRSFCPSCGAAIPARWNIPLISWTLLRGKSRCCSEPLDKKDFAWEISGALLGALLGGFFGPWALLLFFVLTLLLSLWLAR